MENYLDNFELVVLGIFILNGFIIASIYDFFRAIRKVKRQSNLIVNIQDIIFCIIASAILITNIVIFMREQIRLYIIVAIILGGITYFNIFSNLISKVYILFIKTLDRILAFIFSPFTLYKNIIKFMYAKIQNYLVICCKKIKYVIFLVYKFVKKDKKICLKNINSKR